MNYPVWLLPHVGGGVLIALIAVAHVFISHLAVGGGLFLVLTEMKALRTGDKGLLQYVKRHTRFFLLLTMVFGGISGVGIWWIIALVSPAGTSTLIHSFVFAWATEWVFFIGEIVALLIYYYKFDSMESSAHVKLGWLYFIFAWLSLFVINGIICFMLTPGEWLTTRGFWDGFFNLTFFPSLFFRTAIALMFAGLFGMLTAVFNQDEKLKELLVRMNLRWLYLPMLVLIPSGAWYFARIPAEARANIAWFNPEASGYVTLFIAMSVALAGFGAIFFIRFPGMVRKVSVFVLVAIGFLWMGGFEYLREIARKPFVIYNYMYSNAIRVDELQALNEAGFLKSSRWSTVKQVSEDNSLQAGWELFNLQCMACHTIDGYNDILSKTALLTERGLEGMLTGLGRYNTYMPPFAGNAVEKKALAAYIAQTLHGKPPWSLPAEAVDAEQVEIPAFDGRKQEYVLFAYNDLGMHCISDNDRYWSFLPPANTLMAQLIRRGPQPQIITEGVRIEYQVQDGYRHPEQQVDFWKHVAVVYGAELEPGKGLAGNGVAGVMQREEWFKGFAAHAIPVTPYQDDGDFNPYPVFTIKALDEKNGAVLAETKVVGPTSTEVGCRNCHEGGWRWNGKAGLADETAVNILKAHDRISGTRLLADALNGQPRLCQSCHEDPALKAVGREEQLMFSASIHGFHARFLAGSDAESCNLCHPSRPEGRTACSRGHHNKVGLDCTDCHGFLEDHALSLLKYEKDRKKPGADRLIRSIRPVKADSFAGIRKRMAWLNEPDCLGCHQDFNHTQADFEADGFNKWAGGLNGLYRFRTDGQGVMCMTCHGSPHAVYGGVNNYMENRDNLQPMQYQNLAAAIGKEQNCRICHTKNMTVEGHHKNMLRQE